MGTGNLEGKLVTHDFWPACHNCRFFATCASLPRHPAYPHTWHWGREHVSFSDGDLIVKSWVGTLAIGQPHTGCQRYAVDPTHVREPQAHHRRYLALEQERQTLEATLDRCERDGLRSPAAREQYAHLLGQFLALRAAQRTLTAAAQTPMDSAAS